VIQDAHTIGLIESRERREVSCGYRCRLDLTPGTTPDGERYDAVQRDVVYNHVALVPRGRAGRDVALRLDAADNQILGDLDMKIEIIGGVEYEVGTAAHRKASQAREDAERVASVRLDAASALEGENAALKAENKELKERADAAPEALVEAVKKRVSLIGCAARAKVDVREDMSDEDIRRAVIAKMLPGINLEDRDQAFVEGVFAVAMAQMSDASSTRVREDALRAQRGGGPGDDREDAGDGLPPDVRARNKMIQEGRARASQRHGLDKG
jgi:hypothetical protein